MLESPLIFTWGASGIPKIELLPLLLLLTSRPPQSLNTSSTQNLTGFLVMGLVHMINEIPSCTTLTLFYNYEQTLPTVCYHNSMALSVGVLIHGHLWDRRTGSLSVRRGRRSCKEQIEAKHASDLPRFGPHRCVKPYSCFVVLY